jgi:FAD synthetase
MTRVLANGTFDFIHPGHIHYLEAASEHGDELYVVIACDSRASEERDLVLDEEERRKVVDALTCVDKAILGSEESIFDTVEQVDPDIIALGYDQPFNKERLQEKLEQRDLHAEIVRIGRHGDYSSSDLKS